jgi:hypothetical protein
MKLIDVEKNEKDMKYKITAIAIVLASTTCPDIFDHTLLWTTYGCIAACMYIVIEYVKEKTK